MRNCSEPEYWDVLVNKCMPCKQRCHNSGFNKCSTFCESMKCSKQTGFYYDKLLSSCISCSDVCGQHPTQCVSFCQTSLSEVPEHRLSLSQDQTVLIYTLLGISFLLTISSLLLILRCFVKNETAKCACKPPIVQGNEDGSLKDRLVNVVTTGGSCSESSVSGTPEPIETCVFCYPESRPTIEEVGRHQGIAHPHRAVALPSQVSSGGCLGTVPIDIHYEERPFTIICSPSQEKSSMT
ncbi:hypothetical protein NDU88_001735 [Pleurodeles waltl]|uniref:TACI cysteine-rich domain-containing protein n=1 Tax=Pleurodeles waltl TaxID=8319 RepID=A0AAV7LYH1_PLEWA|nr:hypothetical protein NDU88_001735 [Pleurodeles waltl]